MAGLNREIVQKMSMMPRAKNREYPGDVLTVRFPTLKSDKSLPQTQLSSLESHRVNVIAFLESIYDSGGMIGGGKDYLVTYLKNAIKRHNLELTIDFDELKTLADFLENEGVKAIINAEILEKRLQEEATVENDKYAILPNELSGMSEKLAELGILPDFLTVLAVSVNGGHYEGDDIQDDILLHFQVHLVEEHFPLLATRYDELTPSSKIGKDWYSLSITITQDNDENPQVKIELPDPEIPDTILWSRFTDDELEQLRKEKQKLEEAVQAFNEKMQGITYENLEPLMNYLEQVIRRVALRVIS